MKTAPKHPEEKKRLESLTGLNILDTLPEREFDEITALASEICGSPIALISLIDGTRQWFKSKIGIDVSETPRELAFCAHAILQDEVFVVEDATLDSRFSGNPFVTGPAQVRFYAGVPILSPDGLPIGTMCVIDNKPRQLSASQEKSLQTLSNQITRLFKLRLQIEEIKKSEARLLLKKTAMDNISDGIIMVNSLGEFLDLNPAALEILGFAKQDLLNFKVTDIHWRLLNEDGTEFPVSEAPIMAALSSGKRQDHVIMGLQRSENETRWLSVNATPLFLEGPDKPSHSVASFSDITQIRKIEAETRQLQAQLSESSRLSALGEMAGGVAHEINNPLAIIYGRNFLLKRKLESGQFDLQSSLKDFETIEVTVNRIAKIVRGLKNYSRNAEKDPFEPVRFSDILSDTLELCMERFRSFNLQVEIKCEDHLEIECRSAQISQILMNLWLNSFDAIQGLSEKWIHVDVIDSKDKLIITCTDSGKGIPFPIVQKMMQPFFTTKEVGKGTGLGLSISAGLAESHGGLLKYDSQAANTCFVLELPKNQSPQKSKAAG